MDEILYDSHGFECGMGSEIKGKPPVTIYTAGDILSEGARMRRAWEAEQLRKTGASLHVPHEDKSINDKANAVQEGLAERIVSNDTQGIIDSDVIVIDAHENGKGTLVELGQIKGMRDMAKIILDINRRFEERHEKDGDWATYRDMAMDELDAVYEAAETVLEKKVYAHNTDIRRANDKPQAGDRREYAPNQYVYGTVLDLTNNNGFYTWEEIMKEVSEHVSKGKVQD